MENLLESQTFRQWVFVIAVLCSAFLVTFILRKLLNMFIRKYAEKLKTDPTHFSFIKNSLGFVIYTIAFIVIFYGIPQLRALGTALFAGAGVLALVIGFASQQAFSNIVSGVFILVFKPFRVTDIIEFKDGQMGIVEEITLRHTIIRDFSNRRIIIPNSVISEETIINSSIQDEKIKKHVTFSISYDSNIDKAIDIIREEAMKHPLLLDNRTPQEIVEGVPVVAVRVVGWAGSSIEIKALTWSNNHGNAYILKCDLLKSVKERFDAEGIEIPFPYRTVVFKKDLPPNYHPADDPESSDDSGYTSSNNETTAVVTPSMMSDDAAEWSVADSDGGGDGR